MEATVSVEVRVVPGGSGPGPHWTQPSAPWVRKLLRVVESGVTVTRLTR